MLRQFRKRSPFEETVTPHFNAAYNLARWITNNDHDAEDILQEAFLRAFQYYIGFRGGDARAWLLRIVRNTAYTWLRRNRASELHLSIDDIAEDQTCRTSGPESELLRQLGSELLRNAIAGLPAEFREVIVLRDLEDYSYKEIAEIVDIPLGTVMSRLARARKRLILSLKVEDLQ